MSVQLDLQQLLCDDSGSSSRNRLRYPDRFSAAVEHELRNSDFDAKTISVGIDAGYDSNEI